MKTSIFVSFVGALLIMTVVAAAQDKTVVDAFEHYEQIRLAQSADSVKDVPKHAAMLAPMAATIGGADAKKSADAIAAAKTLDDARKHFGDLSALLVPKFQAEGIPGAHAYMCAMKQKPWMQRGDRIANPYFGKAMASCGSPLDTKRK